VKADTPLTDFEHEYDELYLHGEEPINDTDDGLHHSSNDYPQNISEKH